MGYDSTPGGRLTIDAMKALEEERNRSAKQAMPCTGLNPVAPITIMQRLDSVQENQEAVLRRLAEIELALSKVFAVVGL